MSIPFSYSSRSLWARRTTTIATALGIALVVFVLAASQMLSAGMRGTLLRAGSNAKALVMQHDAYSEDGSRIRQSVLSAVAAAPGVKKGNDGEPLVTGEALVQTGEGRSFGERDKMGLVVALLRRVPVRREEIG